MKRNELEDLRARVPCAAVLDKAGFAIDLRQSTRNAVKYRRRGAIVIVIHAGQGWFDPLSEAKGDIFSLVEHLDGVSFTEALDRVASLVGYAPRALVWAWPSRRPAQSPSVAERWSRRLKPRPGSMTWRYLCGERGLPDALIRCAVHNDVLREGPQGSMWAAHRDEAGAITGWEERGLDWRGFAAGGSKRLFRLGREDAPRLCVTEAAIDAMSLAALEHARQDSLYLSTGGGWSPATDAALRTLAAGVGAWLVAATDNDRQGEIYADRLKAIARAIGCGFERVRPAQVDWNAELRVVSASEQGKEGKEQETIAAACPPAASREASPAWPAALDPAGRGGGRRGGVRRAESDGRT